ncbi:DUF2929 domain-containing protein [Bacillus sp. M6-12]|uniref:YjzD family protein n=1 Tax=Bacillus sp. M6-12 TaxID=2054166 RepID=UPI000C76BDBD|nr:YjzD family protein [Bacillus sp. M6-12]PLS15479.1 DUF2929 domain-containing protein [Bacillus sp. M6-12]
MKYFWTAFWTFLLVQMLTYVVGSMIGVDFNFKTGTILSVVTTILIFIIPAIIPNDPVHKGSH